ncbi:MAG: hypothetical protein CVV05_17705 [Gammaproteobacteria bacterium HGW-Gammaproteobacteria-1]|jgi:hypothetical protein|nr:MAG: hypothetical protein CVV05_17705 [Gammaproteobacteria bacterium HGW-Gammaproteobacteria-1]
MKRHVFLLLLPLAFATTGAFAQDKGYKVTRPDGTVEFTDQPTAGAQEITLPKAQSYEPPPLPAVTESPPPIPQGPPYSTLAITAPTADQTFQDGGGIVTVSVRLEPALRNGHRLVILLDGKEAGLGANVSLSGVERGSHTVAAEVRDGRGNAIQGSAPVTFHMRQYSKLFDAQPPANGASPVGPAPMMPRAPRPQ